MEFIFEIINLFCVFAGIRFLFEREEEEGERMGRGEREKEDWGREN